MTPNRIIFGKASLLFSRRAAEYPGEFLHLVLSSALCGQVYGEIIHLKKEVECADV